MRATSRNTFLKIALLGAVLTISALLGNRTTGAQATAKHGTAETPASQFAALSAQAQQNGTVNVIVSLNSSTFDAAANAQANKVNSGSKATAKADNNARVSAANQARSQLLSALGAHNAKVYAGSDWFIPAIALTVDQATLNYLQTSSLVKGISQDHQLQTTDNSSTHMIGAPNMWGAGLTSYTGSDQVVAILDTGVQENHPFLSSDGAASRVIPVLEGCYSGGGNTAYSTCPGSALSATGAGAGAPCSASACKHGTHVAGIAAGYGGYSGGNGEYGVAYQAGIMAVKVFSNYSGSTVAYDSDIISGLNWVNYNWVYNSYFIAAVNMSIGYTNSDYYPNCDSVNSAMTTAINTLRNNDRIATVIAAGNDGYSDGISYPACISSAISVGATDFQDSIAYFSDSGANTTIFAPGYNVYSSIPGSAYDYLSGTSMATPQVVGALALLRQETGNNSYTYNMSVTQLISMITKTGRLIYNSSTSIYQPRINVDQAGILALARQDTIGIYRGNQFYLRNTNNTGIANQTIPFGAGTDAVPIVGDWPGEAFFDELGTYNRNTGRFNLCHNPIADTNANCVGASVISFLLGNPNDYPIAGHWNPRPTAYATHTIDGGPVVEIANFNPSGVGVFRSTNGILYLKNALVTGYADYSMVLGSTGDVGIAGDWNKDTQSSPGVYRPSSAHWFLTNQVTNGIVFDDVNFTYGAAGAAGDVPVVGNWPAFDSPFGVGPGVYRTSSGYYFVRNTLDTGVANNSFFYGLASDLPVVGDWSYHSALPRPNLVPGMPHIPPTILIPSVTQNAPAGSAPGGNSIGG